MTVMNRNRRNICKYFEDYNSSRTQRSGYLAFLRWLLVKDLTNCEQILKTCMVRQYRGTMNFNFNKMGNYNLKWFPNREGEKDNGRG